MILKVGNRSLRYWSSYSVELRFDAVASIFKFDYYQDEDSRLNRDVSKPLSYLRSAVSNNDEVLITGTILNHSYSSMAKKRLSSISGYSKSGVLADSCIPTDMYPISYTNLSLRELAVKLCEPFNLGVEIDSSVKEVMEQKVKELDIEPSDKIADFLASLASERNVVMTHSSFGALRFTRVNTNQESVFDFGSDTKAYSKKLDIDGQSMFSDITVIGEGEKEPTNATQSTIKNPYVDIFRPITIESKSVDNIGAPQAARAILGQQLKSIKLMIRVKDWTDKNGNLWKNNSIITVLDNQLRISKRSRFFVESVVFEQDTKSQVATLKCVLPEVYNNEPVKNIFNA